jgi:5-methyltetrahydrofolate--homocysteine methyltransferase
MLELHGLYDAVIDGDAKTTRVLVAQALEAGANPQGLLDEYLVPAMDEVGRRFECGDYFVPEMLISSRAMKAGLELIRPKLSQTARKNAGKVAVGTVIGDLHDIGKNLVVAMLEGGGFEVVDLGVDVSPDKFIQAIKDQGVTIVAMSALLTTTMPGMKSTIDALKSAGVRDSVKVMIGGAPITQRYADEIGADGYSDNASAAVRLARELVAN